MTYTHHEGSGAAPDPYRRDPLPPRSRNPLVRAGMSVAEMVFWLVVMAVLAIGMIWMLVQVNR